MPTRREILTKIGVGRLPPPLWELEESPWPLILPPSKRWGAVRVKPPWWLIHPLQNRDSISLGWSVSNLGPVHKGAAILELTHRMGQSARAIHICTYEGKPKGLAHTALFDLILMDGGQGDKPTEETIGRVTLTLADIIAENEIRDEADLSKVTRMLTHRARRTIWTGDTNVNDEMEELTWLEDGRRVSFTPNEDYTQGKRSLAPLISLWIAALCFSIAPAINRLKYV